MSGGISKYVRHFRQMISIQKSDVKTIFAKDIWDIC